MGSRHSGHRNASSPTGRSCLRQEPQSSCAPPHGSTLGSRSRASYGSKQTVHSKSSALMERVGVVARTTRGTGRGARPHTGPTRGCHRALERQSCAGCAAKSAPVNKSERRRRHLTVTDTTQNFPYPYQNFPVRRSFFHPKLTEAHDPSSPRDREPSAMGRS